MAWEFLLPVWCIIVVLYYSYQLEPDQFWAGSSVSCEVKVQELPLCCTVALPQVPCSLNWAWESVTRDGVHIPPHWTPAFYRSINSNGLFNMFKDRGWPLVATRFLCILLYNYYLRILLPWLRGVYYHGCWAFIIWLLVGLHCHHYLRS